MTEYKACDDCNAWCCRFTTEIEFGYLARMRVAKRKGMTPGEVTRKFATHTWWNYRDGSPPRETYKIKQVQPCIFLERGRCSIHDIKPEACAIYHPHKRCQDINYWIACKLVV